MTDSVIKYVGVDVCKAGWIGVGLDDGDGWDVKASVDFSDMLAHFGDASIILVDMPIGLPEDGKPSLRDCDGEARRKLGALWRSVFEVPSSRFVNEVMDNPCWGHPKANEWSKWQYDGGGIAIQSFAITRKIGELDEALSRRDKDASPKIRESHPEICFWALNERQPMSHKKSDREGREERLETLRHCAQDVNNIDVDAISNAIQCKFTKGQVADDDILDALALAITAKIVSQNGDRLGTLPEDPPTDSKGLPMEMVYAKPR